MRSRWFLPIRALGEHALRLRPAAYGLLEEQATTQGTVLLEPFALAERLLGLGAGDALLVGADAVVVHRLQDQRREHEPDEAAGRA